MRCMLPPMRSSAALLVAFALAVSSALADAMLPEEIQLENGLRIALFPHPGSGMVACNVFVGAGSVRETDRFAGSSHFLEHVLFNGTTQRTQEQLYAAADRIGAYNNATTRQEITHFMIVVPKERLAAAIDIQSSMLLDSTLPTEKFEKERGIVLEELSKDLDDPDAGLERSLEEMLYGPSSPFARPVLGTAETIASLPRDSVVAYYKQHYVPANMRVVLMGEFESEAALQLLEHAFGSKRLPVKAREVPVRPVGVSNPAPALAAPGQFVTRSVEAPKAVVQLTARVPAASAKDDALLALLMQILSDGETCRAERALKADPAVPHEPVSGSVQYRADSRWVTLRVRLEEGASTQEAAHRLLAAWRSLGSVSASELTAARTATLTQELSQLEQLHYYAIFNGDRLWHMPSRFTTEYLSGLEDAARKPLEALGQKLASAELQISAAGPGLETAAVALATFPTGTTLTPENAAKQSPEPRRPRALDTVEPPSLHALANGLTLIHAAAPTTRVFAVHVLVRNRSAREPADQPGIADLLHRTMAARIESEGAPPLAAIGATLKVADSPFIPYDDYYTTPLFSFIRFECLDEYYRDALQLLARMLAGPHDDPEALESSRQEMLSALQRSSSQPAAKAAARLDALLQPGHAQSKQVLGDAESLARITPESLAQFARNYLAASELVVAIVGNVGRDELMPNVESTLGKLPSGEGSEPTKATLMPLTTASTREELEGGGKQSALRMGRVVNVDPADRWALLVTTNLASSRMQQDLRETRGLAYSLGIATHIAADRASIVASMGTRPENVAEAEAGMSNYLNAAAFEATAEEIETAVNKYLALVRMRRITSMGQAFSLCRDLFQYDDLDYATHESQGMSAVLPEDVRRAAQRYFGPTPLITVVAK
ncbi:MAG TPA: pitrilysin family protein [Candidatus Krumholzibacteria bacterium]|nr:pitrilysin family protein [Candidatus Krumholzibacteria bacterium]